MTFWHWLDFCFCRIDSGNLLKNGNSVKIGKKLGKNGKKWGKNMVTSCLLKTKSMICARGFTGILMIGIDTNKTLTRMIGTNRNNSVKNSDYILWHEISKTPRSQNTRVVVWEKFPRSYIKHYNQVIWRLFFHYCFIFFKKINSLVRLKFHLAYHSWYMFNGNRAMSSANIIWIFHRIV